MCPILLEIYQKHTNNLEKNVFIFLNNRREERRQSQKNHSVSPGLRLSLLVKFFPLPWLDVSHTGCCSITSHKFLMSLSPVTFNCAGFLLPAQTWTRAGAGGGGRRWRQQWERGEGSQGRWHRPLYNESSGAPPDTTQWRVGAGCSLLSTSTDIRQHFLFGQHFNGIPLRAGLRSWTQCQHIFSLPAKCYRKLSAQSKTQTRAAASIEERFLYKSHFWKWTLDTTSQE